MKRFTNFCIKYAIFITENYISMDWSEYKTIGKVYYYPFWFIRSCIIWAICPIFYPVFWFKQISFYQFVKKMEKDPKYQEQMMRSMKMFNM